MSGAGPDVFRALAVVCEGATPDHAGVVAALGLGAVPTPSDHTETFILELPPYAAIHVGGEGMLGGDAAQRVAGFWHALGVRPPAEPDHLAALLGLYASLIEVEAAEGDPARRRLRGEARRALLWEHLLSWTPLYLAKLSAVGRRPYRVWAALVSEVLLTEAAGAPPPVTLPLHLREAPALPGDDAPLDDILGALLAPVRSGMLITRSDLARAAASLGLGLRQGERRFILRNLLAQDPAGVLAWLAGEARAFEEIHRALEGNVALTASFWAARAAAAAEQLERSVAEAQRRLAPASDAGR